MKTNELREKYLAFFAEKGCTVRPSDVLVPRDDPTVLFTPAGMNQFKNEFLGIGKPAFTRATTCQKCLRTGDISNVGVTAYHHTFFEMLGNFSFGDYFKREAIHWAWEFLTDKKWLGLDADRLNISVYQDDDEAFNIWHDEIKLPTSRIRRDNEDENFWPAGAPTGGPDGVCGPCSEIFYNPPGGAEVEIWNLVFTQFNRVGDPPDNLRPLPKQNIDTGMGLERTAAVLQGVQSNFENDVLRPLCLAVADVIGVNYEFTAPAGRPVRRIADHVRAVTFCVHEGVAPDREKANYVVRQLLRRASLEGYLLGREEPFLFELVPAVVDAMCTAYPELRETVESVSNTIKAEETQFLDTIDRGLQRFNRCLKSAQDAGHGEISGRDAFDMHTEDGFLIELTEAMAARHDMTVNRGEYEQHMEKHRVISGTGAFAISVMAEGPIDAIRKSHGDTESLAYESTSASGLVVGIICDKKLVDSLTAGRGAAVGIVLDRTPFYGEAGGQVGDTGTLVADGVEFEVLDTQRNGTLIVHLGHLTRGSIKVGDELAANVDAHRRGGIRRAHSATHILHHALHETIGDQATQRGSRVERDALRFDFAHKSAMTPDEIARVEDIINQCVAQGAAVTTELLPLEEARKAGAMALFGEKYPDRVRVVRMGDFSTELCGGTHLDNTGQVGLCRIVSEEPVAKGVRRITALTGQRALDRIRESDSLLRELSGLLKTPADELPRRVAALQNELKELRRELAKATSNTVAGAVDELISAAETVGETRVIARRLDDISREALRDFVDPIRSSVSPVAIILGTVIDGKVSLIAAVSRELVKRGVNASDCVRIAAKVAGGSGGGRPDMAEAGAKLPEKIDDAITAGREYYVTQLGS